MDERAIVDLVRIAAAYVFLHEVRHLMFQNAGDRPANSQDEEIACDRFAREFLFGGISDYCRASGYAEDGVSNKRLAGIALGAFIVLYITNDWAGSETHPPLASRLRVLIRKDEASIRWAAWDYLCCLLLSVLRRERKLPAKLTFTNPQDLFEKLVKVIESQKDPLMPAR